MRTRYKPVVGSVTPAPPENELERFVYDQLLFSRESNQPVSRHALSLLLADSQQLPRKEALAVVETYCDENAPMTPEYLGDEFLIPYLKISALVLSVVGVALIGLATANLSNRVHPLWMYPSGGIMIIGAAYAYVRSLRMEARTTS
ncbi:MAG: hypothetical protein JSS72_13465 [Armatimonadetes bacterium]|nr:hypothetical protein [Armatimonadota bacterium]